MSERIYTKPGPAHKRQPSIFSPQRSMSTERLKELEVMAWNSEVNILKQKKKAAKEERKRNEVQTQKR